MSDTKSEVAVIDSEIINQDVLTKVLAGIEEDAGKVIISEWSAQRIRTFKNNGKLMAEVEKTIKDRILEVMQDAYRKHGVHANSLKAKGLSASLVAPRGSSKYTLEDGHKKEWGIAKTTYSPDVDKIEAYLKTNGSMPEGVTLNDVSPSVSIRAS
jgi:hypothetical protein